MKKIINLMLLLLLFSCVTQTEIIEVPPNYAVVVKEKKHYYIIEYVKDGKIYRSAWKKPEPVIDGKKIININIL
jgi:hypothetical protein